jgi:8-oxo-dGTP pyrophosphatase MutT (NUDIX family)
VIRELREETGVVRDSVGACVADRRFALMLPSGETVMAIEQYFVVHAHSEALTKAEWTLAEAQVMADHHWWSVNELKTTADTVWPEALIQMLLDAGV